MFETDNALSNDLINDAVDNIGNVLLQVQKVQSLLAKSAENMLLAINKHK